MPGQDAPEDSYTVEFELPDEEVSFLGNTLLQLVDGEVRRATIQLNTDQMWEEITTEDITAIQKVITHEMGHVLLLDHPINGEADDTGGVLSVMNQALPDSRWCITIDPSARDIYFLREIWG